MKAPRRSRSRDVRIRLLTADDRTELDALISRDPITHCFVAARLASGNFDAWSIGGEVFGAYEDDRLVSALYAGANLIPIETTDASRELFANQLRKNGRRCSSMVGEADEVLALWSALESKWGPARDVRANQPLLVMDRDPSVPVDGQVRAVRIGELDTLLPACIAMFTEEVGISPLSGGAQAAYRARIAELIASGQAFARFDDAGVVFKAEVGAATKDVCQVQGVWVRPELRGQGLGAPGMAAVVALARATIAPTVSLYVNHYNDAARAMYDRVGFTLHSTFATILF